MSPCRRFAARPRYDAAMLEKFGSMMGAAAGANEIRDIPLRLVRPSFAVSETFLQRLENFGSSILDERFKGMVQAAKPTVSTV